MQKILLGAIIAAAVLLVYPSLMPEQSSAQTTDQSTSTGQTTDQNTNLGQPIDQGAIDAAIGSGLPCNTSATGAGAFLTIDGITGQNGSPCVFEIKDFSFGIENPTTIGSATGGAGAGKAKFNEFTIQKTADSASPLFFKNCATGVHYSKVTLEMRKAGGSSETGTPFLKYTFSTVFTTKVSWSGPGDEGPEESITFVYGALAVQYTPQNSDGNPGSPIASCYDAQRHRIC